MIFIPNFRARSRRVTVFLTTSRAQLGSTGFVATSGSRWPLCISTSRTAVFFGSIISSSFSLSRSAARLIILSPAFWDRYQRRTLRPIFKRPFHARAEGCRIRPALLIKAIANVSWDYMKGKRFCQSFFDGSKKDRSISSIIPNDRQIYRVIIEKAAPPPQSRGHGVLTVTGSDKGKDSILCRNGQ